MTKPSDLQLSPPSNWEQFEKFSCELYRKIWDDPDTKRNGRQGQPQNGVDVYGRPQQGVKLAGVQCKGKDDYQNKEITIKEVQAEIEKAKEFNPSLSEYTILTTGKVPMEVEKYIREINDKHKKKDLFSVHIKNWTDILELLDSYDKDLEVTNGFLTPIRRQDNKTLFKQINGENILIYGGSNIKIDIDTGNRNRFHFTLIFENLISRDIRLEEVKFLLFANKDIGIEKDVELSLRFYSENTERLAGREKIQDITYSKIKVPKNSSMDLHLYFQGGLNYEQYVNLRNREITFIVTAKDLEGNYYKTKILKGQ